MCVCLCVYTLVRRYAIMVCYRRPCTPAMVGRNDTPYFCWLAVLVRFHQVHTALQSCWSSHPSFDCYYFLFVRQSNLRDGFNLTQPDHGRPINMLYIQKVHSAGVTMLQVSVKVCYRMPARTQVLYNAATNAMYTVVPRGVRLGANCQHVLLMTEFDYIKVHPRRD